MKDIVKLVNGSELQKQLEPLYELKSDIANLKTEISKKASTKLDVYKRQDLLFRFFWNCLFYH